MEKEVPEVDRKRAVKKKYLSNISQTLSKTIIEQQELYSLVRGYFSELLKLDYEFTYEELSIELNKIFLKSALKKDIDDFLYDLSESEYLLEKPLDPEQVKSLVSQFQELIKSMTYDTVVHEYKPSFFEKLFGRAKIEAPVDVTITDTQETNKKDDKIFNQGAQNSIPNTVAKRDTDDDYSRKELDVNMQGNDIIREEMFKSLNNMESESTAKENVLLTFDDSEGDDIKTTKPSKTAEMPNNFYTTNPVVDEDDTPEVKLSKLKKSSKDKKRQSDSESQNIFFEAKKSSNAGNLLVEDNSPDMVSIHELMEESYLHINNSRIDDAKITYLKALDIYHRLVVYDKKQVYDDLYFLFKKLKPL